MCHEYVNKPSFIIIFSILFIGLEEEKVDEKIVFGQHCGFFLRAGTPEQKVVGPIMVRSARKGKSAPSLCIIIYISEKRDP
jgi:hypothetical protein